MAATEQFMQGNCKITVFDDAICPPEQVAEHIRAVCKIEVENLWIREQKKLEDSGHESRV